MTGHLLLTVRQPWARAILDGHKLIENRSPSFRTNHRGPLWIHASSTWSKRGGTDERIHRTYPDMEHEPFTLGAVLARVELVDLHPSDPECCHPWGEHEYEAADGRLVTPTTHLVLGDPQAVEGPRVAGALGLWSSTRRDGLTETLDLLAAELDG